VQLNRWAPNAMTDEEIGEELKVLEEKWDAFDAEEDSRGGSPMEWMDERMGELRDEQDQRRSLRALPLFGRG
jgi:hypothetical protein